MWTRSQEWTELISGMNNTHNSLSLTDSTEWRHPWEQPAHWPLAPGLLGRPYAPPASLCQPMSWRYPLDTRAPIPGQQWPLHPLPPTKSKRSVKRTMSLNCCTICGSVYSMFWSSHPVIWKFTSTKWTLHPEIRTLAASTCSWALWPLKEGSREGWMFSRCPLHFFTNSPAQTNSRNSFILHVC